VDFKEDLLQMLPAEKNNKNAYDFLESSKFTERIIIDISSKDPNENISPDSLITFADEFASEINTKLRNAITSVESTSNDSLFGEVMSVINNNLPVFLEDKDYASIDSLLTANAIRKKIQNNFQTLTGPTGLALKQFIVHDPLGLAYTIYNKLNSFRLDDNIELYDSHFITRDKKHLLLFLHLRNKPSETQKNAQFFKKLDIEIEKASAGRSMQVSYFGETAVATGNAAQIRKDNILTSTITVILLVLLIAFFFRSVTAPVLVMMPVVFGAVFSLAMISIFKGSISIIAVGGGSIILGIAVNYSLHFLTHYKSHPNIENVIRDLSFPMIIGSATTIGGFLCLQFLSIPVLRDLGLFSALSLVGAAVSTLIFLPHFISHKRISAEQHSGFEKFNTQLEKISRNKYLILLFIILTAFFFHFAKQVKFENDMTKINYMTPQLQRSEKMFNQFSNLYQKSVFVMARGSTLEDALSNNEKILPLCHKMKNSGTVSGFTNISTVFASEGEQVRRIENWKTYWTPEKISAVYGLLTAEGKNYHFNEMAFKPFLEQTSKSYSPLNAVDFKTLKSALADNFIEKKENGFTVINILKTKKENVNKVYKTLDGMPHVSVFDRQFITDKLIKAVGSDFNFITLFTTLIVFLALLLSYGRLELTLITFIPMAVSWIWILGIMALADIKFNIINIILSTFVFALGDDFCIFTSDSLQQEYAEGKRMDASVRISILLSALTTIIGLGMLVFAKHPALRSIALVSIIGIVCVWVMSQTLQPLLFNLLIKNPASNKHFPITLAGFLKSLFAFSYFAFGAVVLWVTGFVLTRLIPVRKKSMKFLYHVILSKFVGSLVYVMANVKKEIINTNKEDFSKPAVIIANHQSFLDILVLVMLHPKLILLTNNWVWNSPVFGLVVRMADYQLANNTEKNLDLIAEQVNNGYSVVVFPEGTRSKSGAIRRFHKGAFYLAEKLHLDILPIVLHGTGYCMKKGEFLLKNGTMTIKMLDRIPPENKKYGKNYSERTAAISSYFKNEFTKLSEEIEIPSYYKEQLISNYLFKGPVLQWYLKVKLKIERDYEVFHEVIPMKNKILDIGCGYGFLSYMLSFTSRDRTITGIDYDENKISIAKHGFLKNPQLHFVCSDALKYEYEDYDTIILSDILHYLKPDEQELLLVNCSKHLLPNGQIIIRDGDISREKRHKTTNLSVWFYTWFLRFNKTSGHGLPFIDRELIPNFVKKYGMEIEEIDNARYTSNIFFILKNTDEKAK
jgi:1-acyl-sn-glycerol-3-phosphate acyltransferase